MHRLVYSENILSYSEDILSSLYPGGYIRAEAFLLPPFFPFFPVFFASLSLSPFPPPLSLSLSSALLSPVVHHTCSLLRWVFWFLFLFFFSFSFFFKFCSIFLFGFLDFFLQFEILFLDLNVLPTSVVLMRHFLDLYCFWIACSHALHYSLVSSLITPWLFFLNYF